MGGGVKFDKNADPSTYQTNSTKSTVFSLLNSMIGGTMLFLPLYFNKTGLITSTIIMVIMAIVSYKGCDIYVTHMKPNEFDIQEILGRIMGRRWRMLFIVVSSFQLFMGVLLYYSFAIEMIFSIVTFILTNSGSTAYADKSDISFSSFSIQYTALLTFPIFLALLFMKDLRQLIRIAELGVYAIYSYVIFIFYTFITNITSETLQNNISNITYFSFDIGDLASTASLALLIHSNVCPMVKCHKEQHKNRLSIKITYAIGTSIYLIIGVIGGLGVLGRVSVDRASAKNINDFYSVDSWQPLIVETLYLIHLISMFPILFDICRTRVFEAITKDGKIPPKAFVFINILVVFVCALVRILNVSPNTLAEVNGSISCFFIVYLIPPILHLACYHGSNKILMSMKRTARRFSQIGNSDHHHSHEEDDDHKHLHSEVVVEHDELERLNIRDSSTRGPLFQSCNSHTEEIESTPKTIRIGVYTFIVLLGFAIFLYGSYSIVEGIINGSD